MRTGSALARAGSLCALLTMVALAAPGTPTNAQDTPPWPQFQGGPGHPGALADGPEPPYRLRWSLPAPAGASLSAAVVASDEAITVGSEAVYALDLVTGAEREVAPRAGGPVSPPAVAVSGGTQAVLFLEGPQARDEASPTPSPGGTATATATGSPSPAPSEDETADVSALVAVDLGTGDELWRAPLEGISRTGVTVDGDAAFVGDGEGNVYAVRAASGEIAWTAALDGRVDTPLAAADGAVVAVARNDDTSSVTVAVFEASSGERRWAPMTLQASSTAGSAPSAGEGLVVLGAADRFVRALSVDDGSERWSSLALSLFSPATVPAFTGGSVYVTDVGGGVYRLDAGDGERRWSHQLNEVVLRSAPVVSGDAMLLGLADGRLVALDTEDGHLVWQSEPSRGLLGTIALSDDVVVAVRGGPDAGLVAFEHDPGGTLVDVPSPSELDPATTLSRYAIAALIVFAAAFVPGLLARRRLGALGGLASAADGEPGDQDAGTGQEDRG